MFKKLCALSVMVVSSVYAMDFNQLYVRYATIGNKTYIVSVNDTTTVGDVIKACCTQGYEQKFGQSILLLTVFERGNICRHHVKYFENLDENVKKSMIAHSTQMADLAIRDEKDLVFVPFSSHWVSKVINENQ